MNRYLIMGTLAAALAIYAWQIVSNAVLPWHSMSMSEFTDPGLVLAALQIGATEQGMYYHPSGVVAAISTIPGMPDKSGFMGMWLMRQVAIDVVVAFILAVVVARSGFGARRAALTLGGVALAAGLILELSDWNWYGFPIAYTLVNAVDVAINGAIAGLVLGWLNTRLLNREPATPTIEPAPV